MAWIFGLSAECGPARETATAFAAHFDGHFSTAPSDPGLDARSNVLQDSDGNWWCSISSQRMGHIGEVSPETAYELTDFGLHLYRVLKRAPPFRFALVGIEVDEFRTYSELRLSEEKSACDFAAGLVLSQELWQELGSPAGFRRFNASHYWKPYQGEVYSPLASSAALSEQLEQLLAHDTR